MPLADNLTRVYQILGAQEEMEERRRKRGSEQAIMDLYASGQPVDSGSIQKLLASGADPTSVASIAKIYQGEGLAKQRGLNLESQQRVREAPGRAGALKMGMQKWHSLPQEQQTAANWSRAFPPVRAALIRNGIFTAEELPEDAGPQDIDALVGMGYDPAAQDFSAYREEEAGARQGRWEQAEAAKQQRFGQSQAGIRSRWEADRTQSPGPPKPSEFERTLAAAGYEPGSPEAQKAARVKLRLEKGAGGGSQVNQRQLANVQNKLQTIDLLKQQIQNVKNTFGPIKDSVSAGPLANYLPTEKGQSFDAAVSAISPIIRQLTRTPGEGAMSDYEAKLAEAILPSRGKYESVTAQQIQQVEDMVNRLESGYRGMIEDGAPAAAPRQSADDPNRPLTPEEMREYQQLKGTAGPIRGQ